MKVKYSLRKSNEPLFFILKKHDCPKEAARIAARFDFAYDFPPDEAWHTYEQSRLGDAITREQFDQIVDEETERLQESGLKYGFKREYLPSNVVLDVKQQLRDEQRLANVVAFELQTDIWEAVRKYRGDWYVYDGGWQVMDEDEFDARLYEIIKDDLCCASLCRLTPSKKQTTVPTVTQGLINSVKIALHARNKITEAVPGWMESDGEPAIAFENGILVGKGFLPTSADYFTLSTIPHPLNFTTDPPTELLRMFETSGLQEDEILFLQEFVGLCLTVHMMYQRGLLLLGPPRSGKGTFLKVLRWMVGAGNYVSKDLAGFGERFALANLPGKTVCAFEDERQKGKTSNAGIRRLLKIIGGDPLDVERKNVNSSTADLHCKIAIASNYIPELPDESGAVASRFGFVRTRVSHVGKEDRDLFEKIIEQRDELLSWAVRGLWRLQAQGEFTLPDNGEQLKYEAQNSPIRTFLKHCTKHGDGVSKVELYAAYEVFSSESEVSPVPRNEFFKQLKDVSPELTGRKMTVDGQRIPCIPGISLSCRND